MARLGYCRVSTSKQTTDQQRDALEAADVDRIFEDVASGARTDRPGPAAMLDFARPGDEVVVWRLDCLGRSVSHVVQTAQQLHERGVGIIGLNDGVDYSTPTGRMLAGIIAALAEYERTLINERGPMRPGRRPAPGVDRSDALVPSPPTSCDHPGATRERREHGVDLLDAQDLALDGLRRSGGGRRDGLTAQAGHDAQRGSCPFEPRSARRVGVEVPLPLRPGHSPTGRRARPRAAS